MENRATLSVTATSSTKNHICSKASSKNNVDGIIVKVIVVWIKEEVVLLMLA